MAVADGSSIPLAIHAESASPHEVILVGRALATGFLKEKPERLVGERAYDSDPLDEALQEQGIEMIAPHRKKQEKEKEQDGRKLRRYKRRWKIERLFLGGSPTSGGWWSGMSTKQRTSWVWCSLGASLSCSESVYEMPSRHLQRGRQSLHLLTGLTKTLSSRAVGARASQPQRSWQLQGFPPLSRTSPN
jgi:Transposase DDE domain